MPFRPPVPRLEPLFQAHVDVDDPLDVGAVATGQRKVIPITGGSFTGERLKGRVIPGGADWQIVAADGTAYLEARYTLKTHDEALIYVRNIGVRHGPKEVLRKIAAGEIIDPGQYYFR
ncbi:MAG: DUF3237 family protein [Trueperaceae bacterium]|nr:DUF3237 family protein [Trueperaceae bacterium]